MQEMQFHQLANIFPLIEGTEFEELKDDIRKHGLREAIFTYENSILDGRNRYRACQAAGIEPRFQPFTGDDPIAFIVSINMRRRHMDTSQRAMAAARIKHIFEEQAKVRQQAGQEAGGHARHGSLVAEMPPSIEAPRKARDDAAAVVNVSPRSVENASRVLRNGDPALVRAVESGEIAVTTAAEISSLSTEKQQEVIAKGEAEILREANRIKREKKEQQQIAREEKNEIVVASLPPKTERFNIIHCSVSEIPIDDCSVDCIITDPPYPKEFLSVYDDLAKTADRVLKPGGSCFVMVGQSYLPDIMNSLGKNLNYQWVFAYMTPGGQATQLWQRKVNTFWKPVLWFVKGEYTGKWMGDVAKSNPNDNDKRFHHWGQSESGMADLITRFSEPGQTILDPFVGGGTTGVVALDLNRKFIGCDINESCVSQTIIRMNGQS